MSVCDRNCFNCVYEDCICDDLNAEDYALQRKVEREIVIPKTRKEVRTAAKKKAYYEANRDEIAAKQKAYREANRDEIAAKQKAYREANRDKYNRYMREYYHKRKALVKQ